MSWILPLLFRLVFHEMPNLCIFKKPRIWQVFWYMTWYGKHIRKKYRWRQVLWADALIQMPRKTPERNRTSSHRDRINRITFPRAPRHTCRHVRFLLLCGMLLITNAQLRTACSKSLDIPGNQTVDFALSLDLSRAKWPLQNFLKGPHISAC